jgi:hypothetical protein
LRQRTKALLTLVIILTVTVISSAKNTKISGKMIAYDLMKHSSKSSADTQNQEVVVLETGGKQKYAKVMFSSFGTTQIDPKYFDGTQPLEADVFRDHSCDEKVPTFVTEVSLEQIGGTYLLTDAFKNQPPARIKNLECYVAIYKKKKK